MEIIDEIGEPSSPQTNKNLNFLLASAVKAYPILYAKNSKQYRNVQEREGAWISIAKQLEIPVNVVKQKWRNLRDRFWKENRLVKASSASGAGVDQVIQSKWVMFEELDFLSKHCEARPTTGNYKQLQPTEEVEILNEEILDEEILDEEILDGEMDIDAHNSSGKLAKKRKATIDQKTIDEKIESILAKADTVLETRPSRHASFCSYLTERLEMLPLQAARDLEVEFTVRVNKMLDLYANSSVDQI